MSGKESTAGSQKHQATGPNKIQKILEKHQEWLNALGTEGTRASLDQTKNPAAAELKGWLASRKKGDGKANLCRADLRKADLEGANLQGINLLKADLRGAQLNRVDLQGVNLRGAQLQGASLLRTVLREANLQDADLSDVEGLQSDQLAGANLSGATLREAVGRFEALGIVEEKSQNAKRVLLSLLLACIYVFLTVATTMPLRLITNSSSSQLPIINSEIPIVAFYWAAPLILVSVYLYFLLYLQRLWESLAKLPAVFPDGTPLDEKIYPWLPNSLVSSHFVLLREQRPALSGLQSLISIALAYGFVPLTLVFVWGRYLTRQEWAGTGVHIALLVMAVVSAVMFRRLAGETLEGKERERFEWSKAFTGNKTRVAASLVVVIGSLFWMLSYQVFHGVKEETWMERVGFNPFADFQGEENLERFDFHGAALNNANFNGAPLMDADLTGAHLRHATLELAELQGATLENTDLRWARMWDSDLRDAILSGANLQSAELNGANLTSAYLSEARLAGAELAGAILTCADLQGAVGLTAPQVKVAQDWEKAFYGDELCEELGLGDDHNGRLEKECEDPDEEDLPN
jgi:uncharacterized protein YjbI with pentapeptide repeats